MAIGSNTALTFSATITNAEFRAAGLLISSTLEAGGVIKTADSGQIDWTTVAFPGVNSTTAGYEIRRFSDPLQASAPVYVKILYRRGGSAFTFALQFSVGSGSDGAGNLTGIKWAPALDWTVNGTSGATATMYVSAGTNRFIIVSGNNSNLGSCMSFERSINNLKQATADGVMIFCGGSSVYKLYFKLTGTSQLTAETTAANTGGCLPSTQDPGAFADGAVLSVFPFYHFGQGTVVPSANIVGGFVGDFPRPWETYNVRVLGSAQTMARMPVININIARGSAPANTVFTGLFRYE